MKLEAIVTIIKRLPFWQGKRLITASSFFFETMKKNGGWRKKVSGNSSYSIIFLSYKTEKCTFDNCFNVRR